MPSDKRNSITAKATGLISSLFDIALVRHVPFGILQYIQCILHGLTSVLLCVPSIFADSERCQFGSNARTSLCYGIDNVYLRRYILSMVMEIVIVATLIAEVLFEQFLLKNGLNIAA